MYAALVSGTVHPDKMDEFITRYQGLESTLRAARGFQGALLLVNHQTRQGQVVVRYATREDAENVMSSGLFDQLVAQLGDALIGLGSRQIYEVVREI